MPTRRGPRTSRRGARRATSPTRSSAGRAAPRAARCSARSTRTSRGRGSTARTRRRRRSRRRRATETPAACRCPVLTGLGCGDASPHPKPTASLLLPRILHVVAQQRVPVAQVQLAAGHDRRRPGVLVAAVRLAEAALLDVLLRVGLHQHHGPLLAAVIYVPVGIGDRSLPAAPRVIPQHLAVLEVHAQKRALV